jgi:Ca2+ transporting ATPase
MAPTMEAPWTVSPDAVLDFYKVDPAKGLTTDQVTKHTELYGKNG